MLFWLILCCSNCNFYHPLLDLYPKLPSKELQLAHFPVLNPTDAWKGLILISFRMLKFVPENLFRKKLSTSHLQIFLQPHLNFNNNLISYLKISFSYFFISKGKWYFKLMLRLCFCLISKNIFQDSFVWKSLFDICLGKRNMYWRYSLT